MRAESRKRGFPRVTEKEKKKRINGEVPLEIETKSENLKKLAARREEEKTSTHIPRGDYRQRNETRRREDCVKTAMKNGETEETVFNFDIGCTHS